jgi:hypothetical protein
MILPGGLQLWGSWSNDIRSREAIREKNESKYAAAHKQLTDGCNQCHQSARQVPIVIQDPKDSPFPNQDFRVQP